MSEIMRKLTAIFVRGVLACAALCIGACGSSRESKYRSLFLSVPDIEAVTNFWYYEGRMGASLNLTDGRYLDIDAFDEGVGTSTNKIGLHQIGNISVFCSSTPQRNDVVAFGFNILEVMRSSPLQLRLGNIGDVVSHYHEIYGYLEESLPPPQSGDLKQFDVGDHSLWCSRGTPRN
jgi:hypothetical protein